MKKPLKHKQYNLCPFLGADWSLYEGAKWALQMSYFT